MIHIFRTCQNGGVASVCSAVPTKCLCDLQMKCSNCKFIVLSLSYLISAPFAFAEPLPLETISSLSKGLSEQVVAWRRDFHQHPELSNREFRTAKIVADHLEALGMEVQTGIAHTGVIGLLRGGKPGPVVLLRADMDGLPVLERNDLPFKSVAMVGTIRALDTGMREQIHQRVREIAAHHTPGFFIDESGFDTGVKAMAAMAWQYMLDHQN